MPRFRVQSSDKPGEAITPSSLFALLSEVIRPPHFFLGSDLVLEWRDGEMEEVSWEIFHGRLLDPAHTRQRRTFMAWNVFQAKSGSEQTQPEEPLLSLKLDDTVRLIHVVRGLDSYVWEGYDAGGNVYLSRERRKWVRELAGTIQLNRFADTAELRDELACQLFRAVVGTSRLPLSSLEAPLPAFSFGQLIYCYRPQAANTSGPVRGWRGLAADMLSPSLHPREQAHLLQTYLHAASDEEMTDAAQAFFRHWSECGGTTADLIALMRMLFNEVSLSPYTDLVEKTLLFLHCLEELDILRTEEVVDFLSYLLRHIGRHLTAYDLVLFHHRGANYPDALLLDAVFKAYRTILEARPQLFADSPSDRETVGRQERIRRRALRQAWLLRRRYEGHAVPDLPTSPGENMRVLPESHPRVPEEQIIQPARRQRHLYMDDSLLPRLQEPVAQLLRQSVLDLEYSEEWRELGLAVFLDRPLGVAKAATEPDGTLLLSAEAFSAAIARERLLALARDLGIDTEDEWVQRLLRGPVPTGLPVDAMGEATRPGSVALTDARRVASDFVFLRTTTSSVRALLRQFDFTPLTQRFRLDDVFSGASVLLARAAVGMSLVIYDALFRQRVELEASTKDGYESRAGEEYPVDGLLVLRVWEAKPDGGILQEHDLRTQPLRLPPRF